MGQNTSNQWKLLQPKSGYRKDKCLELRWLDQTTNPDFPNPDSDSAGDENIPITLFRFEKINEDWILTKYISRTNSSWHNHYHLNDRKRHPESNVHQKVRNMFVLSPVHDS